MKRILQNLIHIDSPKRFGLCVLSYFVFGILGLQLTLINKTSSPIWPASGLAIVLLTAWGKQYWRAILIGAFAVNLTTPVPWWTAFAIGIGNTAEAVIGYHIYFYFLFRWRKSFDARLRSAAVTSILAPLSSALVGSTAVSLLSQKGFLDGFWEIFSTWWVGDFIGILLIFPFLIFYREWNQNW
ncbi:MAG: MASE1 domain-containing protein, partial [Bdellovibrionales bacterium]|nr:MASE1 domain-containing protein [Bdellovibrionales bacterium]